MSIKGDMYMTDEFRVDKGADNAPAPQAKNEGKVIDERNYNIHRTQSERGPSAIGRGGDPLFRRINASKEQLLELIDETQTIQDWTQREISNNVALTCLDNENLKEIYYEIKDGFGEYGKISLMGFKTPSGVEIPRLKIYDKDGEVLQVLSGPMAIDELNKRALAYRESVKDYDGAPIEGETAGVIQDYSGNPDDYIT